VTRICLLLCLAASPLAAATKTFVFHNAIRDLEEFRTYAKIASRLKRYGAVQIDIGVLAEKSRHLMPAVRSPWHEYGAYMASPAAFFPHPKVAPHLPAEWVAKNRELLLAKAAVLRELGLEAVFSGNETQYLPESFFREHPHLRGPRVDHPRRSAKEEFAWCVDLAETLEIIEWMVEQLKRNVPEIQAIHSWNNDSGSGLCYAAWQYSGPNGPAHCRGRHVGARVRGLMEAMDRGARKGGGPVQILLDGSFAPSDLDLAQPLLPPYASFRHRDNSILVAKTMLREAYPVRGLIDVLAVLQAMERFHDPEIRTVRIETCQSWYYRANEPIQTVERLVEIVEDSVRTPARGLLARIQKARALAARWGGEKNADRVLEGFDLVRQSFRLFVRPFFPPIDVVLSPGYAYTVTNRLIARPLVIRPDLLAKEEEAYFLPYIFATQESDARLDYNVAHGARRTAPDRYRSDAFRSIHDPALEAASIFESVKEAPEASWFRQLAISLRLWASMVRSHDNFYFGQLIRDRNREVLAGEPRTPARRPDSAGDADLLQWNDIQRDELDNTQELIALLNNGGLELVARARDARDEDTFLLGPDILGALQKKADIMRKRWLDAQRFLMPAAR